MNPKSIHLQSLFQNDVVIRGFDAKGRQLFQQIARNSITHACCDVVINALTRSGPFQPTHLYARFGDDSANPGNLSPEDNDIHKTTRSDFVTSSDGIRGGLWVEEFARPLQESSDSTLYRGNRAWFLFRIPYNLPASQISPSDNFAPADSYIWALGLAVAVAGSDRTQDLIIAVLNNFTPFPVPPGGQISVDYPMQMRIPED